MRSIKGEDGRHWDVFVGKASYGEMMLLFACRDGDEVRKDPLASDNPLDAERALAALTESQLHERLRRAAGNEDPTPPSKA